MAGAARLPEGISRLPRGRVAELLRPVQRFMAIEAASGVVLILCTVAALALANSPWRAGWAAFWETRVVLAVGDFELAYPLGYWINDALMTIFFFVIGLEIKRELALGELSDPRKVALPVAAAVGGAVVPAVLFAVLRHGTPDARGWAVPMATDIAFVVGCLALLGPRVPHGLKILMLTLAIVDDLLAVIVIALFYSSSLDATWLSMAVAALVLIALMNRSGVRSIGPYVIVGAFVWLCTLKGGIHPTVAGAALGLMTPWRAWVSGDLARNVLVQGARAVGDSGAARAPGSRQAVFEHLAATAREALSPLDRLQSSLHGWVAFGIMPIFALANAGVDLGAGDALAPLPLAVAVGLVLGKPLGILAASWLVTRRMAQLPTGVTWRTMVGAGCLAGIGFTMSIFVASLSFTGPALESAKLGVLLASLAAGVLGMTILRFTLRRPAPHGA